MIQTSISGATFSAANCFLLPIGIPVIMGRMDLMYPMLVGVFLATIIDATPGGHAPSAGNISLSNVL